GPGVAARPRQVLVFGRRGDVPARAEAADGERRATTLRRVQKVSDVLLRAGQILRGPTAVDPATFEEQGEAAVAELRAHRGPRLGRREDLLRRKPLAVDLLVVGEGLPDRWAVADPLAVVRDDVATVRPHERHES